MKYTSDLAFTYALFFLFAANTLLAQDDTYYDPANDPAKQNKQQSTQPNNSASDYTDGYGNASESPAYKYDPRDTYSSQHNYTDYTYTDGGYYDEDYDSYFYTTRLYRYYRPNYGVNYYSYWFTPSYYYGFNNWNSWNNTYVTVSYNPWYSYNWWGWNRTRTIVVYDPYYDPYWSYNWGWNSCSHNNWNNWGWSNNVWNNHCNYNSWGYNNGGFCGGNYNYYNNYNWSCGNGYNNGYWNGYNNGYYDGWNSAYGYGNWYNPYYHHRKNNTTPPVANPPAVNNFQTVAKGTPVNKPAGTITEVEIPREGIQRPINTAKPGNLPTNNGVSVKTNTATPYDGKTGNVVVASPGGSLNNSQTGNAVKENQKPTEINKWDKTNGTLAQPLANPWVFDTPNDASGQKAAPQTTKPFVKEQVQPVQKNNEWNSAPPANWGNNQPVKGTQQPVPQNNNWNEQPNQNNNNSGRDYNRNTQREMNSNTPAQQWNEPKTNAAPAEQPRNNYREQPRQEMRPMEQPRQFNQPQHQPRNEMKNTEQPRNFQQSAPRQMEQRSNGVHAAPRGKKW